MEEMLGMVTICYQHCNFKTPVLKTSGQVTLQSMQNMLLCVLVLHCLDKQLCFFLSPHCSAQCSVIHKEAFIASRIVPFILQLLPIIQYSLGSTILQCTIGACRNACRFSGAVVSGHFSSL